MVSATSSIDECTGGSAQTQEGDRAEAQAEQAHSNAHQEQKPPAQPPGDEDAGQVGEDEVGFSSAGVGAVVAGEDARCEGGRRGNTRGTWIIAWFSSAVWVHH